jgi:RNA polymerase sigma factor (sigma-70 family)
MKTGPTLKEQQCAWAVAWQDQGDREALRLLCASVEGLVQSRARQCARNDETREELVAEFRLAVVEAAGRFDRSRPDGFAALCVFYMRSRARRLFSMLDSPASGPDTAVLRAPRVEVGEEEGQVQILAEEPGPTPPRRLLDEVVSDANLTAREWRTLQRHFRDETIVDVARLFDCTPARVSQLEASARRKVRAHLDALGLGLDDFL